MRMQQRTQYAIFSFKMKCDCVKDGVFTLGYHAAIENALIEETVGREIFRFAQHPPHTRFDSMGGFFDQYKELLGMLSPCDMVHLSPRSRYVCYPFKPEMCSKFVKYTMNL